MTGHLVEDDPGRGRDVVGVLGAEHGDLDDIVAEIQHLFLRGGELGLKALAVFRENSKGVHAVGTGPAPKCMIEEGRDDCCGQ